MRTALGGRARRHARRMSPDERQRQARLKALAAKRRSGEPHLTFTTRAAGLALAFCAVLLTLAYPVKEYLGQRGQINSAKAQSVALEKQVASLTEQHQNAQTDSQIENDARLRLHYTYPGQQNYIIVAPTPVATAPAIAEKGHAKVPVDPDATWYQRLWDSDLTASK
jgi:cell division protein FtsB